MIKTDKLIICVAPCGSFMTKEANPSMPTTPDEITAEVYRSWNEGASICHIHARDQDGKATTNPEVFREIARKIREKKCDIILQFSTSAGRELTANIDDGFKVLTAGPEMASVDIGVSVHTRPGEEQISLWTRSFNERMTRACFERGIKPEFEVYDIGGMVEVNYLLEKIPLPKPYSIQFPLDMQRTRQNVIPYSPRNLMHLVDELPADAIFMAFGIAATELPACLQSILLGGHVRVGYEDNLNYSRGVLAKSNAELVARIARMGSELGRKVATPNEARELLGLAKV
jgi:3-keto-5-aminohexanoate cleavage enzyme